MHGDNPVLVLEECSGMRCNQGSYRSPRAIELRVHKAGDLHLAAGVAPLDSMQTGRRQAQRCKQPIESLDPPTAYQRDRAPETLAYIVQ